MPKPTNDRHFGSPRARFYFVIGTTMLAVFAWCYVLLFHFDSVVAFIQSHLLSVLVLAILGAILSGWVQARDPGLKAGLRFRLVGRGLMILVGGAAFLPGQPSALAVPFLVVGFISSFIGTKQLRAARRLKMASQPPNEEPTDK